MRQSALSTTNRPTERRVVGPQSVPEPHYVCYGSPKEGKQFKQSLPNFFVFLG